MKCPSCGQENKDAAKACRKCGWNLTVAPPWFPDVRWHLKTLAAIYAVVVLFYYSASFLLRRLPKPYNIRHIPIEMTPWLRPGAKYLPEEDLKAPPDEAKPDSGLSQP